jgi:hypothetical protein
MEPELRKTYVNLISQNVRGLKEQKEGKKIHTVRPAGLTGEASATPLSRKNPVFGCAVALCTMQNAL